MTFKIQVRSPGVPNCLLYEETRSVVMAESDGVFVIPIGDGNGQRSTVDPGIPIEKVFSNDPSQNFASLICNSGSAYQPAALDSRRLIVSFNDGTSTGDQILPSIDVNYVPFSLHAEESSSALKIGSTPASRVMTIASGVATALSAANFAELLLLVNGNSNSYVKPSSIPTCASGEVLKGTGGAFVCVADASAADSLAALSCSDGKIVKRVSGAWACGTESGVGSESDPTVEAYAKRTPGTGLAVNGSNDLVVDFGTVAGKVVQGNDSRLTDSRAPNGSANGDLSGSYPNPAVKGLRGNAVAPTTPLNGQLLKWNGGATQWEPSYVSFGDLKKSDGTTQMPSACAANETLAWSAITDVFSCSAIGSIDASKITAGTIAYARLPVGTAASTVAAGDDSRLTDNRVASDINGVVTTGIIQRTGAGAFTALGTTAPLGVSAGNIGLAIGTGLALSGGNLVPDFGTTSGKVAQGSDTRFPSGTCASGNYSRWTGSSWSCDADAGTDSTKVLKSGDTMTGALTLPTNGLIAGTNQLVLNGGSVGIGTASPGQKLTVAGTIETTSGGVKYPDATTQTSANNVTVSTVSVSSTTSLSLPSWGHSVQNLTMAASATINIPAGAWVGQFMTTTTCQNGTGGFTPTFAGSGVILRATYPAGFPTLTANKCDVCGWIYYSTNNWILTGCNLNE